MSVRTSVAFSAKARRTSEQPISYLIAVAKANPQLISFAAGLVNPLTLPYEQTRDILDTILSDPAQARDALQYGTTVGDHSFRNQIIRHLETLEDLPAAAMSIGPEDVVLTSGSQQGLYILADVLLDPGDIVIIESPSYFVYAGALSSFGARIMGVPMDADGLVVDELDKLLHRLQSHGELSRVKAVYCQSYFQNPTGLTLSLGRRKRVLDVVKKYSTAHRIVLIEDAAYRELRFEGPALPSIKSFDTDNAFVVSCYTFDKPFAAGLKTGYIVGPADVIRQVAEQKGNHDFGSSHLCQRVCEIALRDGAYSTHLKTINDAYRIKRDAMLGALSTHLGSSLDGLEWTHAAGGLYVWLSLPRGVNTSRTGELFATALKHGVLYVPGEYCFCPDDHGHVPQNHMRLCYAVTPIEQIEPGIAVLSRVIKSQIAQRTSAIAL